MLVRDICVAMENLAPLIMAEEWDNCGLLIGNYDNPISRILLTLDVTGASLDIAENLGSELIIAHHPLIFQPLKQLRDEPPINHIIHRCIKSGLSVYIAHTNLDAALGGVADALAAKLDLEIVGTLFPLASEKQVIDYATLDSEKPLSKYLHNFQGLNINVPSGLGRIVQPEKALHAKPFLRMVNNNLQSTGCIINFDRDKTYRRLLVWGGAFDSRAIYACKEQAIDCIIAGEIKHHDLLALAEFGIHAIAVGHDVTERVILEPLKQYLRLAVPECRFAVNSGLSYNNLVC